MSPILVVGSVAFDTLHNAQGSFPRVLGGSAVYASICASLLSQVRLVGVVGNDYPESATSMLSGRGIDLTGLEVAAGETFHWEGRYTDDLTSRESIRTELNVFAEFQPKIPPAFAESPFVIQTFSPRSRHAPGPSGYAWVVSAAASLPAPRSVKAYAPSTSPRASRGSHSVF